MKIAIPHIHQLPPAVQEMLTLIHLTKDSLQTQSLQGQSVTWYADARPDRKPTLQEAFLPEQGRSYYFLDDALLWISQTNDGGLIDSLPHSFSRVHDLLGPENFSLSSRGGSSVREYVYTDFGITLVGNQREDRLVGAYVFVPMSASKYERIVWEDPAEFERMQRL